jgi:hypothetical protein
VVSAAAGRFTFATTDQGSGVPATNPMRGSLQRIAPNVPEDDSCLLGPRQPGNVSWPCGWGPMGSSFDLPMDDGFYRFGYRTVDVAGNVGPASSRTVLVDALAPVVENPVATLGSSGSALYTYNVRDNVGAASTTVYESFNYGTGRIALSFAPIKKLADWGSVAANAFVEYSAPAATSSQLVNTSHAPTGAPSAVINAIIEAGDHAGNVVLADVAALPAPPPAASGEGAPAPGLAPGADAATRGVTSLRIFATGAKICNSDPTATAACPADAPPEVEVTIQVATSASAGSTKPPFQSVYFWLRDPVAQRFLLINSSTQPTVVQTASGYTWSWRMPLSGAGLRPQTQGIVLAGGLAADGGLLLANPVAFQIVSGR